MTNKQCRNGLRKSIKARRILCQAQSTISPQNGDMLMRESMAGSIRELDIAIRRLVNIIPNSELTILNEHERREILGYNPDRRNPADNQPPDFKRKAAADY